MNSDSAEFLHISDVFIYFGIKTTALRIWDYFKLINIPPASQDGVHGEATMLFRNHPREDILHCERRRDARGCSHVPTVSSKYSQSQLPIPVYQYIALFCFSGKISPR